MFSKYNSGRIEKTRKKPITIVSTKQTQKLQKIIQVIQANEVMKYLFDTLGSFLLHFLYDSYYNCTSNNIKVIGFAVKNREGFFTLR